MIDSGSAINMIKFGSLKDPKLNKDDKITLRGIAQTAVETYGSVAIRLLNRFIKFYVVSDDITFSQSGILGTEFLKENEAYIDYKNQTLKLNDIIISFYKDEVVTVPPRLSIQASFPITNPEITAGYVPLINLAKGLLAGEALVSNINGRGHLLIHNTTDAECSFIIPPMSLIDFEPADRTQDTGRGTSPSNRISPLDFQTFSNFPDPSTSTNYNNSEYRASLFMNPSFENMEINLGNRVQKIKNLLNLNHLNEEEREHVNQIIRENADRFHLPEEKLQCTNITKHTIPTTDDLPIHVKQYRYPPAHKDEIDRQINHLLENDIIQPSRSPYNAPLWIVPKKVDSQGNKRWRLVIDYRNLNQKTIGDAYSLSNISEILD